MLSLLHTSAPSDYGSTSTDLTFSPGSSSVMCVNISVAQDRVVEDTESFGVRLDRGSDEGVVLIEPNATVSILDNDGTFVFLMLKSFDLQRPQI